MADETLTFTLDTGNGDGGDVVIRLRPDLAPGHVERITDGIKNATFIVAEMSQDRPNVYLEVGFAWGLKKPVILIARDGEKLHFDLSHHKCLFYKTIGKLSESLERTILQAFGSGNPGAASG